MSTKETIVERTETEPDQDGIKTVVEIHLNPETGKKTKVTKKVKVIKTEKKISKAVAERKNWPRYGIAKTGLEDGGKVKVVHDEVVNFEPKEHQASVEENKLFEMKKAQLLNLGEKMVFKPKEAKAAPTTAASLVAEATKGSKYLTPAMKAKMEEGGGKFGRERNEYATIRVSNIDEDATEKDLYSIFSKVGPVEKVFLATDRETRRSKGFAFITYEKREQAEAAIEKLNGYKLEHLILSVEWARPAKEGY